MQEQAQQGGVVDGTPVAYDQSDTASHIEWPDGSGVSLQLHLPAYGAGEAYSTYLAMQRLLHDVLDGVDLIEVADYARDRAQQGAGQ